jgi:cytochrome P450
MTLYPEVQTQAQKEIDSVLGPNTLPTLADQGRLPYIDAIVKEVMRWHPVTPLSTMAFTCRMLRADAHSVQLGAL